MERNETVRMMDGATGMERYFSSEHAINILAHQREKRIINGWAIKEKEQQEHGTTDPTGVLDKDQDSD